MNLMLPTPEQADTYEGLVSGRIKQQPANPLSDPRTAQLLALFNALDERGKKTTLAMLTVAVKLHPKEK